MSRFIKLIHILVSSLMLFASNNEIILEKNFNTDSKFYDELKIREDKVPTVTIQCMEYERNEPKRENDNVHQKYDAKQLIIDFNKFFGKKDNESLKIIFFSEDSKQYKLSDQAEKENFLKTIMKYNKDDNPDKNSSIYENVLQAECQQEDIQNCARRHYSEEEKKNKSPCPFRIDVTKIQRIRNISNEALLQEKVNDKTIEQFINSRIILV